jgi:transcriptional regulator with XRE-family HTH domain
MSKTIGRHLRSVRKAKGLSRSEVARSAGLTRRELAAYERGRTAVPDSDLWCLAGSCAVDVSELLPEREGAADDPDLAPTVADHTGGPGTDHEPGDLLPEQLALIDALHAPPSGSPVPLPEADRGALADALGGTPDAIEARLGELIGASRDEAARLRAIIAPSRSVPSPAAMFVPGATFGTDVVGDPAATDRFFAAAPLVAIDAYDAPAAAHPEPIAPFPTQAAWNVETVVTPDELSLAEPSSATADPVDAASETAHEDVLTPIAWRAPPGRAAATREPSRSTASVTRPSRPIGLEPSGGKRTRIQTGRPPR